MEETVKSSNRSIKGSNLFISNESIERTYKVIYRGLRESKGEAEAGEIRLEKESEILWKKNIEEPDSVFVTKKGFVVVFLDASTNKGSESNDLSRKMYFFNKEGNRILKFFFNAYPDLESFSSSGKLALISTAYPENKIDCFNVEEGEHLWEFEKINSRQGMGVKFENELIKIYNINGKVLYKLNKKGELVSLTNGEPKNRNGVKGFIKRCLGRLRFSSPSRKVELIKSSLEKNRVKISESELLDKIEEVESDLISKREKQDLVTKKEMRSEETELSVSEQRKIEVKGKHKSLMNKYHSYVELRTDMTSDIEELKEKFEVRGRDETVEKYFEHRIRWLGDHIRSFIKKCAKNEVRMKYGLPLVGEGWVSETELFYTIKSLFKDYRVVQHSSPAWLGKQHLDIFIPSLKIAFEYMGRQHYEPVDYFGGEPSFKKMKKLDKKKKSLCYRNDVKLIYIKYNESIDKEIILDKIEDKEILEEISNNPIKIEEAKEEERNKNYIKEALEIRKEGIEGILDGWESLNKKQREDFKEKLSFKELVSKAYKLEGEGDLDKAIECFKEALEIKKKGTIFRGIGHCYRKKREFENAIEYYKKAMSISSYQKKMLPKYIELCRKGKKSFEECSRKEMNEIYLEAEGKKAIPENWFVKKLSESDNASLKEE